MLVESPTVTDTVDVLERARALLIEHGNAKGRIVDGRGRICMQEALYRACGTTWPAAIPRRINKALDLWDTPQVCDFNNTHTGAEVIAKFDEAIVRARG